MTRLPEKVLRKRQREEDLMVTLGSHQEEVDAIREVLKRKHPPLIAKVMLKVHLAEIERVKKKIKRLGKVM